jgi:hypothetical protein
MSSGRLHHEYNSASYFWSLLDRGGTQPQRLALTPDLEVRLRGDSRCKIDGQHPPWLPEASDLAEEARKGSRKGAATTGLNPLNPPYLSAQPTKASPCTVLTFNSRATAMDARGAYRRGDLTSASHEEGDVNRPS